MEIRTFDPTDTEAVVELWEECGLTRPWNDPLQDIARKLTVQPELFLVGVEPDEANFDSPGGRALHVVRDGEHTDRLSHDLDRRTPTEDDALTPHANEHEHGDEDERRTFSELSELPAPRVIASAMIGFDGHRGWMNYLAVSPAWRGRGYARTLMAEAERLLTALGCPKLSLQVRDDNLDAIAFYRALGYEQDRAISFGKRLIAD